MLQVQSLFLAIAGSGALAAPSGPPTPEPIYGGEVVAACGWPTTLFMAGCTGSLVHPEVAVLAAHCLVLGEAPLVAVLADDFSMPVREVPVAGCMSYPGWQPTMPGDGNDDIAFCKLAEPVTDVAIAPVIMGCETELLQVGAEVTLVGFGMADDELGLGPKRAVTTTVQMLGAEAIWVGDDQGSACNGDSGGPAYVQLDDGSWRVFGATSGGTMKGPCPQTTVYTLVHAYAEWIETASGVDITPCHDSDGTWNPSELCGGFATDPALGGGSWDEGCGGVLSEPSATCGPPFGEGSSSSGGSDGAETSAADGTTAAGSSSGGATSTGSDGGGDGTAATSIAGTGDGTDDAGQGGSDGGCGCRAEVAPTSSLAWLLVVASARRRRHTMRSR